MNIRTAAVTAALAASIITAPGANAALGDTICNPATGANCAVIDAAKAASAQAAATPALQNNIIWFGSPNLNFINNANTITVWTFTPLDSILWAKPYIPGLWGWFNNQSSQSCIAGISTVLGPYGTFTHAYNHAGCNPS